MRYVVVSLTFLLATCVGSRAQPASPPNEDDYYRIIQLPVPPNIVLEAGGLEIMPGNELAIATRRGEIYTFEKPFAEPPHPGKFSLYASGLHEVLGLSYANGWLYATQRGELTRLRDSDGDQRADVFETVCDDWHVSGDYHEYAFGSRPDREGNIWIVLCLTGSFSSNVNWRGWCVRVTPSGQMLPTCSGIRSPGGIGFNASGDVFYTDNQGPWNGSCTLKHLKPGSFQGHPDGNKWYSLNHTIGVRPPDPQSGSRMMIEAKKIPQLEPPAVYFPYQKMGQSAAGIACDVTAGKFGPFGSQLFVADQAHSTVMRVFLEKIKGHYQGACFPFRQGFGSGALSVLMTPDGSLFVGGTNRGWGSRGTKPFSLERLVWTGKTPFEVHEMRAKSNGFELTFTKPVDLKSAQDPSSYRLETYTYIYQSTYGSPEVDGTRPDIEHIEVAPNRRSVRLTIRGLQEGHVHELNLSGLKSIDQEFLLHSIAYYTLNYIP